MNAPKWLDELGRQFWARHYKALDLNDQQAETFALLCQTWSHYRQATDLRSRKIYLDFTLKLCKEFGLTPRSGGKKTDLAGNADELDTLLGAA